MSRNGQKAQRNGRRTVDPVAKLELHYRALEASFAAAENHELGELVVPNGNAQASVHRWFHLKEAYSCLLLERVLGETGLVGRRGLRILDPFVGGGTTPVSVADVESSGNLPTPVVYGIENNPFLHLVAATKTAALQKPPRSFVDLARSLAASVLRGTVPPADRPALSTFQREDFFDRTDLDQLLSLRTAIEMQEVAGRDPLETDLAKVCLGAIAEPVSHLRRDGRALRRVRKTNKPDAIEAFLERVDAIAEDLPNRPARFTGRILRGDGRSMSAVDGRFRPFDLIVFSPPYPNNIDYTEVYKLENWLLGFIRDSEQFADQRLATVYSHPSLKRSDPLPSADFAGEINSDLADLVAPIEKAVPSEDRYFDGRVRMIRGYGSRHVPHDAGGTIETQGRWPSRLCSR